MTSMITKVRKPRIIRRFLLKVGWLDRTIRQQMKSNVLVRNNLHDERDGLVDLIYAKFGSSRRVHDHIYPHAKPQLDDSTVKKFILKYSAWLSKQVDDSEETQNKYVNEDIIKNLLNEELVKRKKLAQMQDFRRTEPIRNKGNTSNDIVYTCLICSRE